VSIEDIQAITTFSEYHVADAMNIISAAADDEGLLDEEAFSNCVLENFFVPTAGGGAKLAHEGYVKAVAAWLFQCFDADHNGFVDSAELISGLTILCVGSRQDKVRAAFSAFDQNGDGFISYAEMTAYLRSVFSLMFAVKPDIQGSVSVSADQLAEVTSQQAFAEADLNYDGKLSYAEFTKWYMATNNSSELLREADGVKDMWTLEEIRSLTGLGEMPVREVFLVFASAADKSGTIDRDSFDECVARLVGAKSNLSAGAIERMADELYDIFDADGNGVVDLIELSSGLSILCGGDRDDKVLAAFSLFDTNGDGYISKKEMALYLSSVFKLIYATKLELQSSLKISAEELGAVTADQAFEDADIDHDGEISYLEFKRWYASGGGAALNQHQGQVSSNMTLSVVLKSWTEP
jgi:Ca2+-binding EF-hand superfamily protein